jgi:glycosyl-4,4'-diaponeurosporenoate acyltransferase
MAEALPARWQMEGTPAMNATVLTVNIIAWPVIQLSLAKLSLSLPERYFVAKDCPTSFEMREVTFYRNALHIRQWKHLLPDGASWLSSSFSKSKITSHDLSYLLRFALEARRGELAHWAMFFCFPIFYLWNPPWASIIMTIYAIVANLPCIIVQRYNRLVILRGLYSRVDNQFSS